VRLVRAAPEDRKAIFRQHVLRLRLFQHVRDALVRQDDHRLPRDFVLELAAVHMPNEDFDSVFATFAAWGRFADLLAWDERTDAIELTERGEADADARRPAAPA
jgi:NitT/TauT family transport system ATP-binding protein